MKVKHAHILRDNKRSETWRNLGAVHLYPPPTQEGKPTATGKDLPWSLILHRLDRKTAEQHYGNGADALWTAILLFARPKQRLVLACHDLYATLARAEIQRAVRVFGLTVGRYWFADSGKGGYLELRRGQSKILLLDLQNYLEPRIDLYPLPGSVERPEIAEIEPPTTTMSQLAGMYAKNRYEAFYALLAWIREEDLGNPQKTIGSQAMSAFRHRFMKHPIYLHDRKDVDAFEREAYFGGRCQAFYLGPATGHFSMLDVRSMYPSIMATMTFPCKLVSYSNQGVPLANLPAWLGHYHCIARVQLCTDEPAYPFRTRQGLRYPVGRFTTTLSQESLCHAYRLGRIEAIEALAIYEAAPLFEEYMAYCWRTRQAYLARGEVAYADFVKRLMNSFSGKWGQKQRLEVWSGRCDPGAFDMGWVHRDGEWFLQWRAFGKEQWFSATEHTSFNALTAIVAAITDRGQRILWDLIQEAGPQNVYYCDTDGVIVNRAGYRRLAPRLGEEIGELTVKWTAHDLIIHGPKDYEHDGERVQSGLRKDATYDAKAGGYRQHVKRGWYGALQAAEPQLREIVQEQIRRRREKASGFRRLEGWQKPDML